MKVLFKKFRDINDAADYATLVQEDLITITYTDRMWYVF